MIGFDEDSSSLAFGVAVPPDATASMIGCDEASSSGNASGAANISLTNNVFITSGSPTTSKPPGTENLVHESDPPLLRRFKTLCCPVATQVTTWRPSGRRLRRMELGLVGAAWLSCWMLDAVVLDAASSGSPITATPGGAANPGVLRSMSSMTATPGGAANCGCGGGLTCKDGGPSGGDPRVLSRADGDVQFVAGGLGGHWY
jgi:hypothetical protein